MSLDRLLQREDVLVFLTDEDQRNLRRLMEHDVHEPVSLTAAEAQGAVVGVAIQWVVTTFARLTRKRSQLVLWCPRGPEEGTDWITIFMKAMDDAGEPNTTISLHAMIDFKFLEALREIWESFLGTSADQGTVIRFAIRWRMHCLLIWHKHQHDENEPQLGIRDDAAEGGAFHPLGI